MNAIPDTYAPVSREPVGRKLFSFAVIADTHVNEHEAKSASPFETNARANGRARHAFAEIAALDPAPEFVVHLGDIVNPMPGLPVYADAAARFKDIVADLRVPLHLVPGNHDVGDKSVDWMPADIVTSEYVDLYRRTFGADYHAFDCGPLRCIVIDAQLLNSDLPEEAAQRDWLEAELAASAGRRVFLFTHYPPYVLSPEERGTYDNIDQPGRAWLLELLRRHRVEALFAGHVHNFWYDVHGETEMYLLPATSFLRHDYSEFYRVAPGNEFGRGDVGKFGYCVVDIHERGHVMRLVRTDGRSLGPQQAFAPRRTLPPANVKTAPYTGVGVELRHAWAEIAEIPSTGGVQEFGRKPARNDYPVMGLWEMGARLLKLPDHDLTHPVVGERMKLMHAAGHRFIATAFGVPREPFSAAMQAAPGLVEAVEVNLSTAALTRQAARLRAFRERHPGTALYWAKLRMHEDAHYDGGHFSHFIKTGTLPAEFDAALAGLEGAGVRSLLDGLVVRLERDGDLLAQAAVLADFAERSGLALLGAIKLTDSSIARTRDDDLDTARLVAEAMLAARLSPRVRYVFDTFMDIDRGYYPRNGFIDRMFNPRPALRAYAAMAHLLAGAQSVAIGARGGAGEARTLHFALDGRPHVLVSGAGARTALAQGGAGVRELRDLCSGTLHAADEAPDEAPGLWVAAG
ncbi:MAG: metallophosphoesterase [Betaproteobacteria bacterium]|nr:metallophosphoesterase [Betaproteobacteria bacterium]